MAAKDAPRLCKDCLAEGRGLCLKQRPAPHPGPRCATHHREVVKARRAAAHETRVQKVYGLKEGDYARLLELQRGRCALCRRANGATKKLAVDHDHRTGAPRGLLCGPCNKGVIGHSREEIAYFERCIKYLTHPPAKRLGYGN